MVQLKVATAETSVIGNNFYLGVRVGDSQKFSKCTGSYNFKFSASAAGTHRYGKVELFKRVGTCSVSLDKALEDSIQEITLPGDIKFKVGLSEGVEAVKSAKADKSASEDLKARAAKDYLDSHHMELRLAEAMHAVLTERPADPGAFFAQRLVASANMVTPKPQKEEEKASPVPPASAGDTAAAAGTAEPERQEAGNAVPDSAELLSDARALMRQVVDKAALFNDAKEVVRQAVQNAPQLSAASPSPGAPDPMKGSAKTGPSPGAPDPMKGFAKEALITWQGLLDSAKDIVQLAVQKVTLRSDARDLVQQTAQKMFLLGDARDVVQQAVRRAPMPTATQAVRRAPMPNATRAGPPRQTAEEIVAGVLRRACAASPAPLPAPVAKQPQTAVEIVAAVLQMVGVYPKAT